MGDEFRMSESMLKYAKNDEVVTIRLICRRIRERMESIARSQQGKKGDADGE
nr:MAG TPA: hypothetical protein [Caudoviricetes sp.]